MGNKIVQLEHIYKSYFNDGMETPVLYDINFSIEEGDYIAVMGPSGSGKSTLMNLIGCLDAPTSGSIILDGQDISKAGDKELSEIRARKIGFVFQHFQLLNYMTALENVALPLSYINVPRAERLERAKEMLIMVGLEDRMMHKPNQLSGGQKQRVAIARAAINSPKILLADEPTGALDSKSGEQVMELFDKLNKQGVTILMITHEPGIAARARVKKEIYDGRFREPEGTEPSELQESDMNASDDTGHAETDEAAYVEPNDTEYAEQEEAEYVESENVGMSEQEELD